MVNLLTNLDIFTLRKRQTKNLIGSFVWVFVLRGSGFRIRIVEIDRTIELFSGVAG